MGDTQSVPKPPGSVSTGGDNPLMDGMSGGFMSSAMPQAFSSTPIGDVGFGQTNALPDVRAVNATLNNHDVATPYGFDVVDTDAIKAGQQKLSQASGIDLKQDGWVGPRTRKAFTIAKNNGLTKPIDRRSVINPMSSTKPEMPPTPKMPVNTGGAQSQMAKPQGLTAQQRGQKAFQAMKSGNLFAPVNRPKMPTMPTAPKSQGSGFQGAAANRQKPNAFAQAVRSLGQKPPKAAGQVTPSRAKPAFKPMAPLSDAAKQEAQNTVDWTRRNIKGIGDLGKDTMARAVDHGGEPVIAEVMQTAQAFDDAGMRDRAEQLLKDTYDNVQTPHLKNRLKEVGNRWYNGEDVFGSQGDVLGSQNVSDQDLWTTTDFNPDIADRRIQAQMEKMTGLGLGNRKAPNLTLPAASDEVTRSNAGTVEHLRRHVRGIGDLGEHQGKAIERIGADAMTETFDLAGQLKDAGMEKEAKALVADAARHIETPDLKQAFGQKAAVFNEGGDPFAEPPVDKETATPLSDDHIPGGSGNAVLYGGTGDDVITSRSPDLDAGGMGENEETTGPQTAEDLIAGMEAGRFDTEQKLAALPDDGGLRIGEDGPVLNKQSLIRLNDVMTATPETSADLRTEIYADVDAGRLTERQGGALLNALGERNEYGGYLDPDATALENRELVTELLYELDSGPKIKMDRIMSFVEFAAPFRQGPAIREAGRQTAKTATDNPQPNKVDLYAGPKTQHGKDGFTGIDMQADGWGRNVKGRWPDHESGKDWPLSDKSVDELVMTNPYQNIDHIDDNFKSQWRRNEVAHNLKNAHRVLKPGGRYVITGNVDQNGFVKLPKKEELEAMGWKVVQYEGAMPENIAKLSHMDVKGQGIPRASDHKTTILVKSHDPIANPD